MNINDYQIIELLCHNDFLGGYSNVYKARIIHERLIEKYGTDIIILKKSLLERDIRMAVGTERREMPSAAHKILNP